MAPTTAYYVADFTVTVNYPGAGLFANRKDPIADYLTTVVAKADATEMTRGLLYKVIAEQTVQDTIANTPGVQKWPTNEIDKPINQIVGALNGILSILTSVLGSLSLEITLQLPAMTSRQAMKLMATERTDPTFNTLTRQVVYNGQQRTCEPTVDEMDSRTKENSAGTAGVRNAAAGMT